MIEKSSVLRSRRVGLVLANEELGRYMKFNEKSRLNQVLPINRAPAACQVLPRLW